MFDVLQDCCDKFLRENDGFWATAALTGCSFETGTHDDFSDVVNSLVVFGLPPQLKTQLLKGVNGNLASVLEERHPNLKPFSHNYRWKGIQPDLRFGLPETVDEVVAEVKALHDLTTDKFYRGHGNSVAHDSTKLSNLRNGGFIGHLFQIVFFITLPRFERPAGTWIRSGERVVAWRRWRNKTGIGKQYDYVRGILVREPAHGLVKHPLTAIGSDVIECMSRRYSKGYKPDVSWSFSPDRHLADAEVGYAIWQYKKPSAAAV